MTGAAVSAVATFRAHRVGTGTLGRWFRGPAVTIATVALFVAVVGSALLASQGVLLAAAVVLIVGAAIIVRRPWLGLAVLAVQLPVDAVGSRLLRSHALSFAWGGIKDLVLLLLLVASLGRQKRTPPTVVAAVAALVVLAVPAALRARLSSQTLYGFRNDIEPMLLLVCVPALIDKDSTRKVTSLIASMAQASAAFAIAMWTTGLQWLITLHVWPPPPGNVASGFFSAGDLRPRAFGSYGSPNNFAVAMDISLAVILCREDWSKRRRLLLCAVPLAAIYLSRSRSGLLGVALLAAIIAARWLRPIVRSATALITTAALGGAAVVLAYVESGGLGVNTDPSAAGHAASVSHAVRLLIASPFGYGLGQVGPRAIVYSDNPLLVESFLLVIALEAGVLAVLIYLYVLARAAARSARAARADYTPAGGLAYLGFAAIAASIVSQAVLPTMQSGSVSYLLWTVVGIALWQAHEADAKRDRRVSRPPQQRVHAT